mmetsp:Transcript_13535/g.16123  ORF Transcript_13535/g.16123 Transcript_13535/m.16123 type:complete len:288 (-) Transcript_13535:163-1026(-)
MFQFMSSSKKETQVSNVKDSVIIRPVESITGSLVEEMRSIMFGRSFIPTTNSEVRSKKVSSSTASPSTVNRPSFSKGTCCEKSFDDCDSLSKVSCSDLPSTPSQDRSSAIITEQQQPVTPIKEKDNSNHKVDSVGRKKKRKHRRKSDHNSEDPSSAEKVRNLRSSPSSVEDQSTLPNHILIPTFTRVMTKGLVLTLISEKKQNEFTFWIENRFLKWGKQRQNGSKEKGQIDLKNLSSVEDTGPLELKLVFLNDTTIEMSASSSVEKSLLLRSFLLAIETGIYQQEAE